MYFLLNNFHTVPLSKDFNLKFQIVFTLLLHQLLTVAFLPDVHGTVWPREGRNPVCVEEPHGPHIPKPTALLTYT